MKASNLLVPERSWSVAPPYANGCSEATWKRFVDGSAAIREATFKAFCRVLGLNWQEVVEPSNDAEESHNLELRIGISSEASKLIADFLRDIEYITNTFQPQPYHQLRFTLIELGNEEAGEEFRRADNYDIVMLDDPWIPGYRDAISPLDEEPIFNQYLTEKSINKENLFGQIFLESFKQVCIYNNQILGLPLIGNVQLLIHRCDVEERITEQIGHSLFERNLRDLNLNTLEELSSISQSTQIRPLIVRDDTDNDKVGVFWGILRALDHEERVEHNAIFININKAMQARSWLYNFTQQMSFTDIQSSLLMRGSDIVVALGWPGWISGALSQEPLALKEVEFQRFTNRPVMGAWCLALPKYPARPEFRENAVKVMLALTADPNIQFFLAKRGNIPVLANFPKIEKLRQIPFWRKNYFTIRNALISSLPRPRTKYWTDIEKELSNQIHEGHFKNVPGRLMFIDSL